ncbi:MAG: DUF4085 family protein [Eubacteriales bacterium]|nr:DUF4085 family protein [Eubacteriales bacterium]MDD4476375.1 DUF4085 family protein [Eubacteriales bacterium]
MTKEWYETIQEAYCKETSESAVNNYLNEYKKTFNDDEPVFIEKFCFHDCKVISQHQKERDVVLKIDNSIGFTSIKKVIFKNCSILKQDAPLHDAWWLYDEIYKIENGYEIHVLLLKKELIDFIVSATGVDYKN